MTIGLGYCHLGLGLVATPPVQGVRATNYNPVAELGSDLIAYWDANRGDSFSVTDNVVRSWRDIIAGYELKAADPPTSPVYWPTSLSGSPAVVFSGSQYLTCIDAPLLAALPSGASPCELWALVSQDALPADASERCAVSYGGSSLTTGRAITRVVTTDTNRARGRTGTGAGATNVNDTVVDFSGVHVARQIVGATQSSLSLDGGSPTNAAAVPSTTNQRLRVGSINASAPSSNWIGKIAAVLVTLPLSEGKATALHGYLG